MRLLALSAAALFCIPQLVIAQTAQTIQGKNCFVINDVQQCWGEVKLSEETNKQAPPYISFSVAFPCSFASEPVVTDSVQANYPNKAPMYAIYRSVISKNDWVGTLGRVYGSEGVNPPGIKMQYIAIGPKGACP